MLSFYSFGPPQIDASEAIAKSELINNMDTKHSAVTCGFEAKKMLKGKKTTSAMR